MCVCLVPLLRGVSGMPLFLRSPVRLHAACATPAQSAASLVGLLPHGETPHSARESKPGLVVQDVIGRQIHKVEALNAILDPQYFVRAGVRACLLCVCLEDCCNYCILIII